MGIFSCFFNLCCFLGPDNANIGRIINIFGEAFYRDTIDPTKPEGYRILNIVRQVQSNENIFQSIVAGMRPEHQQALHSAFQAQTQQTS